MVKSRKSTTPALVKKVKRKKTDYKMTKPMRQVVQKLIDSNIETHYKCEPAFGGSGSSYENHTFFWRPQYSVAPGGQRDLMKLIPAIEQGVGSAMRIGDQLNLQSVRARFHFSYINRLASSDDRPILMCRLLVLSCKKISKYADLVLQWQAGLNLAADLLKPAGEGSQYIGDPYSITWPVNRDLFTVHADRRFTLNSGERLGDDQSNFHMPTPHKVINVNLKVKSKKLRYAEDAREGATNFAPFGILLVTRADSHVTEPVSVSPVTGNCSTCVSWQD